MRSLLSLSLLAVSLFTGFAAAEHGHRRNHDSLARRANADVGIHKRFSGTRWTFYDVGMGACGDFNNPGDFIVALNSAQFGGGYPGPNCFKSITMSYNGKTTSAKIMDECPGCPWGGLDLSKGLFDFFAPESEGVLTGEWWFNDGSGGGGDPTTSKWTPPKTTSTWQPPVQISTPQWEPPSTSSKWEPPSTSEKPSSTSTWEPPSSTSSPPPSSSSSSSSSTPSVSSINFSSGAASGLAVPSGIISENPQQVGLQGLLAINEAIVSIGALIVAGAQI